MNTTNTRYSFKRYEKKFLLSPAQAAAIVPVVSAHLLPEEFGRHTICNIYYDTARFDLVRHSLTHPPYKEKFRLRSYGVQGEGGTVFAEIKKKYNGVVYKRRIDGSPGQILDFLSRGRFLPGNSQIEREISAFFNLYAPEPKVFLAYERTAYVDETDNLRVTFDENIRFREEDLNLCSTDEGTLILSDNSPIMEVKTPAAIPLWLTRALSDCKAYPTGFSKYGQYYCSRIRYGDHPYGQ